MKKINNKYFILFATLVVIYILGQLYIKMIYHDKNIIKKLNDGKTDIACEIKTKNNGSKLIVLRGNWYLDKNKKIVTNGEYICNIKNCFEY